MPGAIGIMDAIADEQRTLVWYTDDTGQGPECFFGCKARLTEYQDLAPCQNDACQDHRNWRCNGCGTEEGTCLWPLPVAA